MHTEVKSILEYKNFKGTECFCVEWTDSSISWERIDNLSCRELVCGFLRDAIVAVKESERAKEDEDRRKSEDILLEKMLAINMEELSKVSKMQQKVFDDLTTNDTNTKTLLMGFKRVPAVTSSVFTPGPGARNTVPAHVQPSPSVNEIKRPSLGVQERSSASERFSSSERSSVSERFSSIERYSSVSEKSLANERSSASERYSANERPITNERSSAGERSSTTERPSTTAQETRIKAPKISEFKHNTITVKISNGQSAVFMFYFKKTISPLLFSENDILPVKHMDLQPYIHNLYLSQARGFHMLPCVDADNGTESAVEVEMRTNKVSLVCSSKGSFWIIASRASLGNFFNIQVRSKIIVFHIGSSEYLRRMFQTRGTMQVETAWLKGTFKFGIGMLTDKVTAAFPLAAFKKIFVFGDATSALMRYLISGIERSGRLGTAMFGSDCVLVQESYLCHLHMAPAFYNALRSTAKFFILRHDGMEEILPRGGMITFSDEFIREAEILEIANFLKKLEYRPSWKLSTTKTTYEVLKLRINTEDTAEEHLSTVRSVYKAFKNAICKECDWNLRDYLEMGNFRTHRHFIEIRQANLSQVLITMEEASKLMNMS